MVGRQFHDEVGVLALKEGALQKQSGGDRQHHAQHIQPEHHRSRAVWKERRRKQGVHRQAGAAAHEGCHEDRHEAILAALQRASGGNRRYGAPETHQQRNKRFSREPDPAHEAVHHKRRPRHVSGVLQQTQHEEHHENDRYKGGHRLDSSPDATGQDADHPLRGGERLQKCAKPVHEDRSHGDVKKIDKRATHRDSCPEHQVHRAEEHRDPQDAAHHHPIDAVGYRFAGNFLSNHVAGYAVDKPVPSVGNYDIQVLIDLLGKGATDFRHLLVVDQPQPLHHAADPPVAFYQTNRGVFRVEPETAGGGLQPLPPGGDLFRHGGGVGDVGLGGTGGVQCVPQNRFECLHGAPLIGLQGDNWAVQMFGQVIRIDTDAVAFGHIHHVEHHQHRYPHFD